MFTFYTFSVYIRSLYKNGQILLSQYSVQDFILCCIIANSNLLAKVPWPQRVVQDALQLTLIPPFTCSAFDASRHFCSTWVAHWHWNLFSHFSHSSVFWKLCNILSADFPPLLTTLSHILDWFAVTITVLIIVTSYQPQSRVQLATTFRRWMDSSSSQLPEK